MGGRGGTKRQTRKQTCDICSWKFRTKKLLADHHTRHHFVRRCPNCSKTFLQTKKFLRHLRSHTDDQPYECKICVTNFSRKRQLVSHRKHCVNPKLACDQCPMKLGNIFALINHKEAHREGPYECNICYVKFSSVMNKVRHMLNHLFTCALCIVHFPTNEGLMAHILEVHRGRLMSKLPGLPYVDDSEDSDEGSDSMEDSPSSSGEDTGSDSDGAQEMDTAVEPVHTIKHKNKFICFICLLLFPTSESLQVHMKDHKWFPCSKCPKFFSHAHALQKHEGSCCVAADLSNVQPMRPETMESLPKPVDVSGNFKQAIESHMTNILLNNPNYEIKSAKAVHREREIKSVLVSNQSSCPSFSVDSLLPQERPPLFDECGSPSLNFLHSEHMIWLTNFVNLTKSLDFPIDSSSLKKVIFIERLVQNALHHPGDVPLSEECVSRLSDIYSDLCEISTWHLNHIPKP